MIHPVHTDQATGQQIVPNKPDFTYEPPKPRYVVQSRNSSDERWLDVEGYYDLSDARLKASELVLESSDQLIRVIDTEPESRQTL